MSNKEKLQELIVKVQEMSSQLTDIKGKMTLLLSEIPNDVDDSVKLFVTLKHQEIEANNLESWEKIKELPHPVVNKWEQQIYLIQREFWSKETEYKELLGEPGYKQLRSWAYSIETYLRSILCNPSEIDRSLVNTRDSFNKCNGTTKKYIQKYFDNLKNLILLYEDGTL